MASKPDTSSYERFSDVTDRLDEIVAAVRDKGSVESHRGGVSRPIEG